jgi:hypothetical protein
VVVPDGCFDLFVCGVDAKDTAFLIEQESEGNSFDGIVAACFAFFCCGIIELGPGHPLLQEGLFPFVFILIPGDTDYFKIAGFVFFVKGF